MPALTLKEEIKLALICLQMQNVLFYVLEIEAFLRYLTILCNVDEYKRMGQDLRLCQLYDVHNEIKISTKHWLGLLIYYDCKLFYKPVGVVLPILIS